MEPTKNNPSLDALVKQLSEQLSEGKPLTGQDGVFTPLLKRVIEASLEGEMDAHLKDEKGMASNRRNGQGIPGETGNVRVTASSESLECNGDHNYQLTRNWEREATLPPFYSTFQPLDTFPGNPSPFAHFLWIQYKWGFAGGWLWAEAP